MSGECWEKTRHITCSWKPRVIGFPPGIGPRKYTKAVVDGKPSDVASPWLLSLRLNPVQTIEGAEKLVNVTELRAPLCGFRTIPEWIGRLDKIENVSFHGNDVEEIPLWFMEKMTLKFANFRKNRSLRVVATAKSLVEIDLSGCDLRSLPDDFFHHRMVKVHLSGNRGLRNLPPLPNPSTLSYLDAENCTIESVPESFLRLEISVYFKGNLITELPREATIEYLSTSGKFYGGHFLMVPFDMKHISLEHNPLVYPPKDVFVKGEDEVLSYLRHYAPPERRPSLPEAELLERVDAPVDASDLGGEGRLSRRSLSPGREDEIDYYDEADVEEDDDVVDGYNDEYGDDDEDNFFASTDWRSDNRTARRGLRRGQEIAPEPAASATPTTSAAPAPSEVAASFPAAAAASSAAAAASFAAPVSSPVPSESSITSPSSAANGSSTAAIFSSAAEAVNASDIPMAPSECVICFENRIDCALSCGHLMCGICADQLSKCPWCREWITDRRRIFL